MAHELDFSLGRAALAYAGEVPWHSFGKNVTEALPGPEMMREALIDWTVSLDTIKTSRGYELSDFRAVIRDDTGAPLGVVSPDYLPINNVDALAFLWDAANDRDLRFESAGAIRGGKTVFMLAQNPKEITLPGDDRIRTYLLVTTGHDGKQSLRLIPTAVRVICANTHRAATVNAGGLSFKHTKGTKAKLEEIRRVFAATDASLDHFEEQAHSLAEHELSRADFDGLLELVTQTAYPEANFATARNLSTAGPADNSLAAILGRETSKEDRKSKNAGAMLAAILANHDAHEYPETRGTAWAAYNAVSRWTDHGRTYRGADDVRAENRFMSTLLGKSDEIKHVALDYLLESAGWESKTQN